MLEGDFNEEGEFEEGKNEIKGLVIPVNPFAHGSLLLEPTLRIELRSDPYQGSILPLNYIDVKRSFQAPSQIEKELKLAGSHGCTLSLNPKYVQAFHRVFQRRSPKLVPSVGIEPTSTVCRTVASAILPAG